MYKIIRFIVFISITEKYFTSSSKCEKLPNVELRKCSIVANYIICDDVTLGDAVNYFHKEKNVNLSTTHLVIKHSRIHDLSNENLKNVTNIIFCSNLILKMHIDFEKSNLIFENNTIETISQIVIKNNDSHDQRYVLSLENNKIKDIENGAFNNMPLQEIHLTKTGLTHLPQGVFIDLEFLCLLNFSQNHISNISRDTFKNLKYDLLIIDLSNNRIDTIAGRAFVNIYAEEINLSKNKIAKLEHKMFVDVKTQCLNLSNNEITQIKLDAFSGIDILRLDLSKNKITKLETNTFKFLSNLSHLDLSNNPITLIEPGAFYGLTNVSRESYTVYDNLFKLPETSLPELRRKTFTGLKSLSTLDLSNKKIIKIFSGAFLGLFLLEKLYLNKNKIEMLESETFFGLEMISEIDLSNNLITSIAPNAFKGLNKTPHVLKIYLQNNKLKYLPAEIFSDTPSLQELNIAYNRIDSLDKGVFSDLKRMTTLNISNNLLTELSEDALYPLISLENLYVNDNRLEYIEIEDILKRLKSLKTVNINSNNWGCNGLKEMTDEMRDRKVNFTSNRTEHLEENKVHGISCIPGDSIRVTPPSKKNELETLKKELEDVIKRSQSNITSSNTVGWVVGLGLFLIFICLYIRVNSKMFKSRLSYGRVSWNRNSRHVRLDSNDITSVHM